jgi:hypothetical protein
LGHIFLGTWYDVSETSPVLSRTSEGLAKFHEKAECGRVQKSTRGSEKMNNLTAELKRKNPGMNNVAILNIVSTIGTPARRPRTPLR